MHSVSATFSPSTVMKLPYYPTWLLTSIAGLSFAYGHSSEKFEEYSSSGPETSLDSMWASVGHMQTLTETTTNQINVERFHDDKPSQLWFNALGSFGNASVRNNHPAFHYSAGGGAAGYDYCMGGRYISGILGLAIGQVFGHQDIKAMPDHPDGAIEADRFKQNSFMGNIYGGLLMATGQKSYIILSMNAGFASTDNDCIHDEPDWDTWTYNTGVSAAWRYQATKSFAISPFIGLNYTHAENKKRRDDGYWDDYYDDRVWDNRGKFDNLSLEAGLALEHTATFASGATWSNSIAGSFCSDVVRNNPHYTFVDNWWEGDTHYKDVYHGHGYPASRQAFKGKFISRFISSKNFSVYMSYQICFRDSYVTHQAAIGTAISF